MRESTELKEIILREASDLFIHQGYAGTSIKQIAGAAGCTTAALYYYFTGGKQQILREVMRSNFTQKFTTLIQAGRHATCLEEWIRIFGEAAMDAIHKIQQRSNWIDLEIHHLDSEDQSILHQQMIDLHQAINAEIQRFIPDPKAASALSWLLPCAFAGYGQIFLSRKMKPIDGFSESDFVEAIASLIGKVGS